MNKPLIIIFFFFSSFLFAQFPFEKHNSINYTKLKWDIVEKKEQIEQNMMMPKFFKNGDTLSINIVSYGMFTDSTFIKLYRNKKLYQTFFERATFSLADNQLYKADINGDNLLDLKFYAPQPRNGIAYMYNDVVYLFQNKNETFTKISFGDMFDYGKNSFEYRNERDFDGDHNYEIITMSLIFYNNHSYWKFDLYNYFDGKLINVSLKNKYPIMIQYLFHPNYKITNKISPEMMKTYIEELPDGYDKE
jgi:hypothetical protein